MRQRLGEDWGPMLLGVARSTANPTHYRTRALDLMQLYGPSPAVALLLELSGDKNEIVRAKAAELMGIYGGDEAARTPTRPDRGFRSSRPPQGVGSAVRAGRQLRPTS